MPLDRSVHGHVPFVHGCECNTCQQSGDAVMTAAMPRDAATVVVVRDAGPGLEVLLLQRAERGDHNSGAWVFPGGLVDPGDRAAGAWAGGLTDEEASARLGLERGGLAFFVAAVRECFEECGILFAHDPQGAFASLEGEAGTQLAALRHELEDGACDLGEVCRRYSLRLAPEHNCTMSATGSPRWAGPSDSTRAFFWPSPRRGRRPSTTQARRSTTCGWRRPPRSRQAMRAG
ncbi:MAG: NUDIX domain-containing protein [Comamonadaceae bacterium]|nr:MAG: NUDIX domain-containing protein [Comamonadaceae bacterium]